MPRSVSISVSRGKAVKLLALCTGFVAIGSVMVVYGHQPVVGGLSIAFFGLGVPIGLRQILDRQPRLVIDEQGILDRSLGVGVIPWSEIEGAYAHSISGNAFICLELRDAALFEPMLGRFPRATAAANRALGFTAFNINLSSLAVRKEEVLELIRAHREAHGRKSDRAWR